MSAKTFSTHIYQARPCRVEIGVQSKRGVPELLIHGLKTAALKSTKERILMAVAAAGFRLKAKRTLVTIAAQVAGREGVSETLADDQHQLDAAIAIALMIESQLLPKKVALFFQRPDLAILGSLDPNGSAQGSSQMIGAAASVKQCGFSALACPGSVINHVSWINHLKCFRLDTLSDVRGFHEQHPSEPPQPDPAMQLTSTQLQLLAQNPHAARTLQLAAAGGHHTLLIGSPGWGKTSLAQTIAAIVPPLSIDMLEQSMYLHPENADKLMGRRAMILLIHPHTALRIGQGVTKKDTIHLNNNPYGVTILDELPAMSARSLMALRTYFDSVSLQHPHHPQSTIIATGNPCRCGFWQSAQACRCTDAARKQYWTRIGAALLDRFQVLSWVEQTQQQINNFHNYDLETVQQEVQLARSLQNQRFCNHSLLNAQASWEQLLTSEPHRSDLEHALALCSAPLRLSKRGQLHILRVARTIADLHGDAHMSDGHIHEALQYRQNIYLDADSR